uniref:Uncharacterized protein n=1 Tax=Oryza brachyantha TaxID=4533 RepID=J3L8M8_ORYBR
MLALAYFAFFQCQSHTFFSQDPIVGGSLLLTYTTGYVAPLLIAASFAGALQSLLSFRRYSAWK